MREIKFRAWDKFNRSWIYSDHQRGLAWFFDCLEKCENSERFTESAVSPLGFELMQFTGLKDKNGREIYEGDIVQDEYNIGSKIVKGRPQEVIWVQDDSCYGLVPSNPYGHTPLQYADYRSVIGNIYENPELLAPASGGEK